MSIFDNFFNKGNPEEELKGLIKAQEILDERFKKKQVSPETYKKKSLEFMEKRDRLQKRIDKLSK